MTAPASTSQSRVSRSLLFGLGDAYYRVELKHLKAVYPWARLEDVPEGGAKRGVVGFLNLRGEKIPVVDLNDVVHGEPTKPLLGSRILLLDCVSRGKTVTVGALASEVFAMARDENSTFAERLNPCELLSSIAMGLAS
jgi:chemotaxis signal transduction protein